MLRCRPQPGRRWPCRRFKTKEHLTAAFKLVDAFEKKFPNSPLLSYVYTEAARAHQQNGAFDEAVQYCRKSLKLDPDNTFSLIIMALVLPQPKMLKGSANEVAGQLSEAAADANRALALLEKLQKRPDETDEQFQARKGSLAADAHFALGMEEMQRDQFDKAVAEYQSRHFLDHQADLPVLLSPGGSLRQRGAMSPRPSKLFRKHRNWPAAHRCRKSPTTSSRNYSKRAH